MPDTQLVTVEEVAEALRLSTRTIWRMVDDGRIPAYRIGPKVVRFSLVEVCESVKTAALG